MGWCRISRSGARRPDNRVPSRECSNRNCHPRRRARGGAPAPTNRSAGRVGRSAGADRQCLWRAGVRGRQIDGNEIDGIRLPPIAVPLGTYTGWNVYRPQPGELADHDGSLIPFARPGSSARQPATQVPRSTSATAAARPMSSRSRRLPRMSHILYGCAGSLWTRAS
jgi:hypothetical protein